MSAQTLRRTKSYLYPRIEEKKELLLHTPFKPGCEMNKEGWIRLRNLDMITFLEHMCQIHPPTHRTHTHQPVSGGRVTDVLGSRSKPDIDQKQAIRIIPHYLIILVNMHKFFSSPNTHQSHTNMFLP